MFFRTVCSGERPLCLIWFGAGAKATANMVDSILYLISYIVVLLLLLLLLLPWPLAIARE